MNSKEFHNDLQHWLMKVVSDHGPSEITSHRQLRMNTKQLLSEDDRQNDDLMAECVQSIANEVYGYGDTIDYLIDMADFKQLQQIHTTIRIAKGEDVQIDDDEKEQTFIRMISPFYRLTVDCILRICMFLHRTDVNAFKLVSHQISKICSEYMQMFGFRVCDVNKLWKQSEIYKNTPFLQEDLLNASAFGADRCTMEMQFEWERVYGIPVQYQLIYRNGFIFKKDMDRWRNECVGKVKDANRFCFLFDRRSIVVINSNKSDARIMEEDDCRILPDYHLVLLQHFDVLQQSLYFKQVLLVKKNVTAEKILSYVKDAFIGLNEDKDAKVSLHRRVIDKYGNAIAANKMELSDTIVGDEESEQIVLMIQYDAVSFEDNILIKGLESEYEANEETFCLDANTFCDKLKGRFSLKVYYLHDASLLKVYLSALYGDKLNTSWNDILGSITSGKIMLNSFEMNEFSNYGTMRIKISRMFDEKVDAKRIELFRKTGNSLSVLPWNMQTHRYDQDNAVYFDFVDYNVDAKEQKDNPMVTYFVKIFTPNQCRIPLMGSDYYDGIKTTMTMQYRYKFTFGKEFVDCVMKKVSKARNKECFADILKLYKQRDEDILYAMHCDKRTYFEKDEFEGDRDGSNVSVVYLLMYRNPKSVENEAPSDTFPITIRFLQATNTESSAGYLSGIPLKLFVKNGQTLKDVMERDLKKQSEIIEKVYRLEQEKMTLIYAHKCKPQNDDLFVLQVSNQELYA